MRYQQEYSVLRLMRDITNPAPDRRSKDWHKYPMLKAGMRFLARLPGPDGYATIESSDQQYGWIAGHSDLGKLIISQSAEVSPITVRELAKVYGCDYGADSILKMLLKLRRISAHDFIKVAEAFNAEDEESKNEQD